MYWCKRLRYLTALSALFCGDAMAEGYVLGLGAESDTAGGRAASVFADLGVAEKTWLSGAAATTQTGGDLGLDTIYVDAGIDHSFDPVGVRIGAAYWGDADILDSVDLRGSVYVSGDLGYLSADYERREFDFTFASILNPDVRRTTEFSADGFGMAGRIKATERTSFSFGGTSYRYSRDINLQPNIDILSALSTSRLSLMNSLIDYRAYVGADLRFGLSSIDLRFEKWQTAIDGGKIDSVGLGVLTPASDRSDLEFRFVYDRSENFGRTISLSAYYYYFGG
jgi:hypothetical protein